MNNIKSKEPIKLRRRTMPSGNVSLYLDIYLNGVRTYEYLKLYLLPEKTKADREQNRRNLQLAEAIRAKRVVELQNGEYGFKAFAEETPFYDYYVSLCDERFGTGSMGNWGNWRSCLKHMEIYDKRLKERTFADITPEWVQGFKDYLDKKARAWTGKYVKCLSDHPLARNSKVGYFNKLRACLNQAFEQRIIRVNPMRGIEGFKAEEGTRMYLTLEELGRLAQTPCEYANIKRAFLFSCLTGLRRSDIVNLTWSEIQRQGDYTRIIFRQKKTKGAGIS